MNGKNFFKASHFFRKVPGIMPAVISSEGRGTVTGGTK